MGWVAYVVEAEERGTATGTTVRDQAMDGAGPAVAASVGARMARGGQSGAKFIARTALHSSKVVGHVHSI